MVASWVCVVVATCSNTSLHMFTSVLILSLFKFRVKAYISNGWDSRIVDPTFDKQYAWKKAEVDHHKEADNVIELNDIKCWPKRSLYSTN